ncbi:hypothetical protein [Acetatifactor muris]|uniref:hypothetical protein n=1 Tax=Acetatifactor muris TaxID=879566 RepID=UPI0023F3DD9E|nr:hypothetical protein [Acetatifactor muris]
MNIKEKVLELLKYCSSYQGHSYMVDERRTNGGFQVTLPEEEEIIESLDKLRFVLLTGEAGDGKSYLLKRLDERLKEYGFHVFRDFSELLEQNEGNDEISEQTGLGKKEIMQTIADIVEGKSEERIIIAANVGIFTKTALMYQEGLLEAFNQSNDRIKIVNFEKRNLAGNKIVFKRIVEAFFAYDGEMCINGNCPYCQCCPYKNNIDFLSSPEGIESIRILCDTVFLMGNHITFRELLSLLAHMVTLGESCEERMARERKGDYGYQNIFELTKDKVLQKISRMDPAYKNDMIADAKIHYRNVEDCKREKRLRFFHEKNKYRFLAVDYLSAFQTVLHDFEETPYIASEMIQDGVLYQLKRGIGRLTRRGESNLALKVADTPSMLGDDIQTEFELGNMDIIWHQYGLDFNRLDEKLEEKEQNCFEMSYVYPVDGKEEELSRITMVIDYRLFRYLMMADEYYYLSHNSKSIEEYTINTFFRKILKKRQGAYEKMLVKFVDQKRNRYCNFSLNLQEMNRILYRGKKVIKLKKES